MIGVNKERANTCPNGHAIAYYRSGKDRECYNPLEGDVPAGRTRQ